MDDNPFVDPTDANPFEDPSIQAATGSSATHAAVIEVNDNDNPFHDSGPSNQRVSGNIGVQSATADLRARQAELDKREAELRRRENLANGMAPVREKNWPPLPTWSPIKPCIYQDIDVEIPSEFQPIITRMYHMWMGYVATLMINVLAFAIIMFLPLVSSPDAPTSAEPQVQTTKAAIITTLEETTTTTTESIPDPTGEGNSTRRRRSTTSDTCAEYSKFGSLWMSMIWCVLFAPASMIWYRSLYKAFRDDSSFQFFLFFFLYFFQLIFHIIQTIGATEMGYGGWLQVFKLMGCNTFAGLIMLVTACLFTFNTILCFMQIIRVHDVYKASGKTLAQAQSEWASGVISNPTVQTYAREAAGNVIQQEVNRTMGTH